MISPPAVDLKLGLLTYASPGPRFDARLREADGDFGVEEIVDLGSISPEPIKGGVPVYRVEKKGIDTPHMARIMEERLRSRVNFGGLKDKRATATQYVSAKSSRAESPAVVEHQLFRATRVGFSPAPITRRTVSGNRFSLVLRGVSGGIAASIEDVYARCSARSIPNFFGYQRFGLRGMTNHRVGKEIIANKFREAVGVILCDPREGEGPDARQARELARAGEYGQARSLFTPSQDIERRMLGRLLEKEGDYLGALRSVPIQVRRLFVQAYQSYLFNTVLSRVILGGEAIGSAVSGDNWAVLGADGISAVGIHGAKEPPLEGAIPLVQLVGYAFRDYGSRFDSVTREVLKEEQIESKRFYVKEAEELSSEGGFRHAPILARDLGYSLDGETAGLAFTLGSGEYATVLVREMVKPENPLDFGF